MVVVSLSFVRDVLGPYGGDGATRGKICNPPGRSATCIPACITAYDAGADDAVRAYERWCDPHATLPTDQTCSGHPWRPEELGVVLERDRLVTERRLPRQHGQVYNELVLDGWRHNANLPRSVEAFFATPGDETGPVRRHHAAFLREHGLSAAQVPLLAYRPARDARGDVFELLD